MALERVPYGELTTEQQAEIQAWFGAAGIDHRRVPVKPEILCDFQADRWVVGVYPPSPFREPFYLQAHFIPMERGEVPWPWREMQSTVVDDSPELHIEIALP